MPGTISSSHSCTCSRNSGSASSRDSTDATLRPYSSSSLASVVARFDDDTYLWRDAQTLQSWPCVVVSDPTALDPQMNADKRGWLFALVLGTLALAKYLLRRDLIE